LFFSFILYWWCSAAPLQISTGTATGS